MIIVNRCLMYMKFSSLGEWPRSCRQGKSLCPESSRPCQLPAGNPHWPPVTTPCETLPTSFSVLDHLVSSFQFLDPQLLSQLGFFTKLLLARLLLSLTFSLVVPATENQSQQGEALESNSVSEVLLSVGFSALSDGLGGKNDRSRCEQRSYRNQRLLLATEDHFLKNVHFTGVSTSKDKSSFKHTLHHWSLCRRTTRALCVTWEEVVVGVWSVQEPVVSPEPVHKGEANKRI